MGGGVRALCPRRGGHLPSSARDVRIPRNLRHLPETRPHGTCAPLMLCSALPVASFTGTPDTRWLPRGLLALALGFGFIHLLWSRPAPCTIYLLSLSLSGNKGPGAGIVPGASLWTDHRPRLTKPPGECGRDIGHGSGPHRGKSRFITQNAQLPTGLT